MSKFFQLCAIMAILSVAVSCGNTSGDLTPVTPTPVTPTTATPEPSVLRSVSIFYPGSGASENHGTVTASKTEGIAPGEKIYLTITPENDYQLDKLYVRYYGKGNAANDIDVTDNSFVMPDANVEIDVSFKAQSSTHTVSAQGMQGGSILFFTNNSDQGETCRASKGTTVAILVLPYVGFELDALAASSSGSALTIYQNTFAMPDADVTVSATFKTASESSYTVTAAQGIQNGKVLFSVGESSDNLLLALSKGMTVKVDATPDNGYEFDTLTVKDADGNDIPVTLNTFVMPESNVVVNASFKKIYMITLTKPTNGNIAVETPRDAYATTDGDKTVKAFAGEAIGCYAAPDSGYKLDFYTITGVVGIVESQRNSFDMPESDVTISATFKELISHSITVSGGANGTVAADKTSAKEGEEITLTVTPSKGGAKDYVVESLVAQYSAGGETNSISLSFDKTGGQVKFAMPDGDVSVTATFAERTYSIALDGGITGGSITGFKASGNYAGQKVLLNVKPAAGYKLASKDKISITGAGASVALDDFYCFTMPKADITIGAEFDSYSGEAYGILNTFNSIPGKVSVDQRTGLMPGATVVITIIPPQNQKIKNVKVTDNQYNEVCDVSDEHVFIMPEGGIRNNAVALHVEYESTITHNIYMRTSRESYFINNVPEGSLISKDIPDGCVIDKIIASKVDNVQATSERGTSICLMHQNDTEYWFWTADGDMLVEVDFKAKVKAKPDTIGDIVLKDGTAVARENRGYLSESQKNDAIAVIFYDGKAEFEWLASKSLGSCVLGVGLAEGYGPWCGNYLGSDNGGYIKFNSTAAHPIYIGEGRIYGGHYYYANGEEIHHVQYYGAYNTCVYGATYPQVRFDGLLRGTNTFATVKNSGAEIEQMYAFNFCHDYKDQAGSRVKGTAYETGWYLPTLPELAELLRSVSYLEDIRSTYLDPAGVIYGLRAVNGTKITNSGDDFYWTSSQARETTQAWLAAGGKAKLLDYSKDASFAVRAIREF